MKRYGASTRFALSVVTLTIALAFGISACSTAEEADSIQDFSSGVEPVAEGSADDGVGSEFVLAVRDLTYSSLLSSHGPPPEYYQILKECMSAQGFEYLLPPPPEFIIPRDEMNQLIEEVSELDPTSSRFRIRYGYGVTTIEAYLSIVIPPLDPNTDLLATMEAAGQQAWNIALVGPDLARYLDPEFQPTAEELIGEPGDTELGGCTKEANEAVGLDYEQLLERSIDFREAAERIEASEGFVELDQDWAQCAAEKGYGNLTWFGSVHSLLEEKLQEIEMPNPFPDLGDEGFATLSEDEFQRLNDWQRQKYAPEDLARVQQEELDLAQDLADCDIAYWTSFAALEGRLVING